MKGDDGNDVMLGGLGKNWMSGGNGDDVMFSKKEDSVMFGDMGNDELFGSEGDDKMFGGKGNDVLIGSSGDDEMFGGHGDDILSGGRGINTLCGGSGKDAFELYIGGTAVITDFQFGQDKIFLGEHPLANEIDEFILGTDKATGFATISAKVVSSTGYEYGSKTMAVLENVTLDQLQAHSDHIIGGSAVDTLL